MHTIKFGKKEYIVEDKQIFEDMLFVAMGVYEIAKSHEDEFDVVDANEFINDLTVGEIEEALAKYPKTVEAILCDIMSEK